MSERNFLRLNDRLALGADGLQWILYKSKAKAGAPSLEQKRWIAISFVHSTKHILERCIRESGLEDATAASALESLHSTFSGCNLANHRLSNLYNAVTGDEIQKKFSSWKAFKESATRRNQAVHKGKIVTKAEAEDSYKAASDLVAYLK